MNKGLLLFLILLLSYQPVLVLTAAPEWLVFKGKHFLVYYLEDAEFAKEVCRQAEKSYHKIASDLGFRKHDHFWIWENRVKIYIYRDRNVFIRDTHAPQWASGKANHETMEIATYLNSRSFIDSVLPHEITHLIFRDFMRFEDHVPLWLNEGVAQWEEKDRSSSVQRMMPELLTRNRFIPLGELVKMDIRTVKDSGTAAQFYAQSISLVGYMIGEHGSTKFRKFCGQLRDGKDLNDALRFTYPATIRNIGELEARWKKNQLRGQQKRIREKLIK